MSVRIVHMAAKVNAAGGVSALCFRTPRAIDMKRASWTLRGEGVTCRKCARLVVERAP